ncbi:MAG: cytochrome c oxidase subunit 3 [Acidimicrobiales bacterium]|nr:cytochrome c oxidase subunit 3 [Acidimicrobiales bacterium]
MTAVASLESGIAPDRPSGPSAAIVAAYVAGGGVLMASIALMAGYYNLRHGAAEWPPEHVDFDEYFSVMLSATILLATALAGWASSAAKAGNRRQSIAALALSGGMALSFVNLAWYTGSTAGFGPSSHAFGTIVIASLVLISVAVLVAVGFLAAALLRAQLRAERASDNTIAASVRFFFIVAAAWMVSPVALYGLMSPR